MKKDTNQIKDLEKKINRLTRDLDANSLIK